MGIFYYYYYMFFASNHRTRSLHHWSIPQYESAPPSSLVFSRCRASHYTTSRSPPDFHTHTPRRRAMRDICLLCIKYYSPYDVVYITGEAESMESIFSFTAFLCIIFYYRASIIFYFRLYDILFLYL